ncbi:MAG: hypothetical protein DRO96_01130 [Candidatus Aenigmatarchaeota archaeon]|nr:MAG: hypothetical protein DRO96_01130 [Candidatus Aenigmarchaeota archaeon]
MTLTAFMNSELFSLVILPLFIFCIRIIDVSLGTIRVIFISRGMKLLAPVLGFFEVLIWLVAIGQLMSNLTSPIYYIAYAGGFATGTYVGMWIENKLSIGNVIIRIIVKKRSNKLIRALKKSKHGFTFVDARGKTGKVKIILTVTKRQNIDKVIKIVKKFNPRAFYSIEDVRFVNERIKKSDEHEKDYLRLFGLFRR